MKLFNTLTQSLEEFTPLDDTVRIYVCGITPYDTTHLGHAFTYVSFDTLIRYLKLSGHKMRYVQNVTDVDDDVLRKARHVGIAWDELGKRETERYLRDMAALNVEKPDVYAYASQEILGIIEIVQRLLELGYAYESHGCVFYSVKQDREFGKLGRAIGLDDYQSMLTVANERGNYPDDTRKKDPLDFVLWQAQAPDEPAWASPWGPGRPGWHIECSAMAMHYLGPQLDIHGGGSDLAFPHHDCEIAQSEHYTEKPPFARFWMHTGMVYREGEKMSKSLGNLILVSNLLREYSADTIRVALQNHHYRADWEFSITDLQEAKELVELFKQVRYLVGGETTGEDMILRDHFKTAMNDDLNTVAALRLLKEASEMTLADHYINRGVEILRLTNILGLDPRY